MAYKGFWDGSQSVGRDLNALREAGYNTKDAGQGLSKQAIHRESQDSGRKTAAAGHQARTDMAKEGGWGIPSDRHGSKPAGNHTESSGSTGGSGK